MSTELRVFISSTFRDLQDERDYLVKKVFPELRAICRERGITLTEIDLRWGLTEEESIYGNVVRRCLEEVDRCRPWFLCITGDRYGYTPTIADIHKDPELMRRFPWVEDAVIDGMSIMEMEVRYGAIGVGRSDEASTNPRARFYFREALPGNTGTTPQKHQHEAAKLETLKQDVVQSGAAVRRFRDPATLGQQVHDDFMALIEEQFPTLAHASSPLQRERRRHESFALSRRQAYIPRTETLAQLNRIAAQARHNAASPGTPTNAPNGMVVVSPSGNGKSALVAYWIEQFRRRNPGAFVVEHYLGIGTEHGDQAEAVRHLAMELHERGYISGDIPESNDELYAELPNWLAAIHGEPLIILLDGLNQVSPHGHNLAWLPTHLPPNVVMIATTSDPNMAQILTDRGWESLQLEPLLPDERQAVIVRFLGESYKSLNARQLRRIGEEDHCAHPLFLRTFLEELRMFGHHEEFDQQIDWYLSANDTHELFQRMLQRMEGDFGEHLIRRVMSLLWCSRRGLSESELADMTQGAQLQLASLVASLDYHLINRDGLLTFFHDYLRTAVKHRYLPTAADQQGVRAQIAHYFSTQPMGPRRVEEEPYQWWKANDPSRLHAVVADPAMFSTLWTGARLSLLEYWQFLGGSFNPVETYNAAAERFLEHHPPGNGVGLLRQIAEFLNDMGAHQDAEAMARRSVSLARGLQHPELAESLIVLGEILLRNNQFAEAEEVAREALQDPPKSHKHLVLLSNIFLDSGAFDKAEQLLRSALENVGLQSNPQHLELYGNLGLLFHYRGRFQEAEQVHRTLMDIHKRALGDDTPEVADTHHNLARVLVDLGRLEEALAEFQRAASIWQRTFSDHHPLTLLAHGGIADVMFLQGNHEQALEAYRTVLDTRQQLLGNRHLHTVQSGLSLSLTLRRMGRLQESEAIYRELLEQLRGFVEPHHHFIVSCMHNLANVLLLLHNYAEAAELLEEVLKIRIAQHGEYHSDVVAAMLILGEARMQQGRVQEALAITERGVQISQQVLGGDHYRTARGIRRLGVIMAALGDVAAAERHFLHAVQIYQSSLGSDHPDTEETMQLLQQSQQGKDAQTAIEP